MMLAAGKGQRSVLTFLVLDLALDIVDGVRALHLQRDGLASEGLDKDLHATTQPQHQMEGGLLLDIVVSQGAPILQLLAGKDQPLLVWRDACSIGQPCESVCPQILWTAESSLRTRTISSRWAALELLLHIAAAAPNAGLCRAKADSDRSPAYLRQQHYAKILQGASGQQAEG